MLAKEPPWPLMSRGFQFAVIGVGVLMSAYVFYRQSEEERSDHPRVQRLRNKQYITFREISEAIAEANRAYSKNDVLRQLMSAVWHGHFATFGGFSRLRLTFYDSDGELEHARPLIISPHDWLVQGTNPPERNYDRALAEAVMRGPAGFSPGFVNSHVEAITLERPHFLRWYARFRAGRYED